MYKKKHFSTVKSGMLKEIVDQGLKIGDMYEVKSLPDFTFDDLDSPKKGATITRISSPIKYTYILSIVIADALDELVDEGVLSCDEEGYRLKKLR